jgi:phosphopantetheine adenylyltransferase
MKLHKGHKNYLKHELQRVRYTEGGISFDEFGKPKIQSLNKIYKGNELKYDMNKDEYDQIINLFDDSFCINYLENQLLKSRQYKERKKKIVEYVKVKYDPYTKNKYSWLQPMIEATIKSMENTMNITVQYIILKKRNYLLSLKK